MVVGNGLLARLFDDYKLDNRILIFASGVSNSNESDLGSFYREKNLLKSFASYQDKLVLYFSSCDVIYADTISTPYYYHKLEMEELVKGTFDQNLILRLPQIIGASSNKYSLLNFFINSILEGKEFALYEYAFKNLINVHDVKKMVSYVLTNSNHEESYYNIINKNYYSIQYIIEELEHLLSKKANYKLIPKGFKPDYKWFDEFDNLDISFPPSYFGDSIKDCYGNLITS
jgi:UDP-2-acetamido-2,6-beta-L-arabino-hexul-4-ose reductase